MVLSLIDEPWSTLSHFLASYLYFVRYSHCAVFYHFVNCAEVLEETFKPFPFHVEHVSILRCLLLPFPRTIIVISCSHLALSGISWSILITEFRVKYWLRNHTSPKVKSESFPWALESRVDVHFCACPQAKRDVKHAIIWMIIPV